MSDTSLKFFPAEEITKGLLGSGYLRTGLVCIRISAFQLRSDPTKFYVSFPGAYKNNNDEWINTVETKDNATRLELLELVYPHIQHLLGSSGPTPPSSPPVDANNNTPSEVQIRAVAKSTGAPF